MSIIKSRTPLYAIAATLDQIQFPDEGHKLESQFHEWMKLGSQVHYLYRPGKCRPFWTVRLFIGGKVRALGATSRGCDAARFADMAAVRFAKYRIRAVSHTNANLNFSAEQVRRDEESTPAAAALLDTLEKYFLDNGIISVPSAERKVERRSRGMYGDIVILHSEIMEALRVIREDIKRSRPVSLPPGCAPIVTCESDIDSGQREC